VTSRAHRRRRGDLVGRRLFVGLGLGLDQVAVDPDPADPAVLHADDEDPRGLGAVTGAVELDPHGVAGGGGTQDGEAEPGLGLEDGLPVADQLAGAAEVAARVQGLEAFELGVDGGVEGVGVVMVGGVEEPGDHRHGVAGPDPSPLGHTHGNLLSIPTLAGRN